MTRDNSRMRRSIGRYVLELTARNLSEKYVWEQQNTLLRFRKHCMDLGIDSATRVTAEAVLSYMDKYQACSATHQIHQKSIICMFLNAFGNKPIKKLRIPITGPGRVHIDWLSSEESMRIFETRMTPRQAVQITAGLLQGMRRIEILRMTTGDARQAIDLRILRVRGKGHKERTIPVHPFFRDTLVNFLRTVDRKSDDESLLRTNRTTLDLSLQRFSATFGRHVSSHTLRRTFGRNLWLAAAAVETISELLGHKSTDMTRKYLGLNLSDMERALVLLKVPSNAESIHMPTATQ
jgi:integrase